ncbi:MAG TPA: MFS transporter, partial [Dehalococcoidia bacterium]|nr:MFS transporter [Dehalococcoidia bacterium]
MPAAFGVRGLVDPRWQLVACSAMHVVNDALFAGLYPMLPLIAVDLGLGYAEVGAVKAAFSGAAAAFQIPAGVAVERLGEHLLLAIGTGWVGLGVILMALAGGFVPLLAIALLAVAGGAVQHPVASAVVSRLFERGRRGTAIGTLNFAGDLGKVIAPFVAGGLALADDWRAGLIGLGGAGMLFAVIYLLGVPQPSRAVAGAVESGEEVTKSEGCGITRPGAFAVLTAIGVLDAAARGTSLTFLPF